MISIKYLVGDLALNIYIFFNYNFENILLRHFFDPSSADCQSSYNAVEYLGRQAPDIATVMTSR